MCTPPNVLLVGESRNWIKAAHSAAAGLVGSVVDTVGCSREAVSRLMNARTPYSHVLVQSNCPDDLIVELHCLTSGEAGSDTRLLILGAPNLLPPGVPVVARASPLALGTALAQPLADGLIAPVILSADELREAVAGPMIELRYQPMVRMRDGRCFGLEALARLNHPRHGTLPPERFVPQAEHAGLAAQLTGTVTSRALTELAGPHLHDLGLSVALNFPLQSILLPDLAEWLDERREQTGLRAEQIVIELVETRPVEDFVALGRAIERLRSAGYGIAVDDLSPALAYQAALVHMPFTVLKFDIGVIRDLHEADKQTFIARTVEAARVNGQLTIAEGVEDDETWHGLLELGVECVQGFLVSRPLPAKTLPLWLHAWAERRTPSAHLLPGSPDQTSR